MLLHDDSKMRIHGPLTDPAYDGSDEPVKVGPSRDRKMARALAFGIVVALAPLTLLIWNQDWFLTPIGFIDPWHYVGFFHFYGDPHFWPGGYKLARLPWILSGWLAFHLFPPLTAAYVLHGSFLVLAVGAMFATAYLAFDDLLVALAAALMLGFLPSFHGSGGWDYHNTAAGAFYLLTAAFLQWAIVTPARRGRAMVFCGAAFALTVHSNVTFINFLPVLAVHYGASIWYAERRAQRLATYLWPWLYGIGAGIGITAVLCVINIAVGRDPWFFLPLVKIVLRYTRDSSLQAAWWQPWSIWAFSPICAYIAVPVAATVVGAITLTLRRSPLSMRRVTAILFIAEAIFLLLLWALWEIQGQTALDIDYFGYPLIPPSILALASILFLGEGRVPRGANIILGLIAYIFLSAALVLGWRHWVLRLVPAAANAWPLVPTILIVFAMLLFRVLRSSVIGWLAFFAVFALANGTLPYARDPLREPSSYQADARCRLGPALDETVVNTMKAIAAADPGFAKARMWFDEKEHLTPVPGCDVAMHALGYSIEGTGWFYLTKPFPLPPVEAIPDNDLVASAQAQLVVVVPTANPDTIVALKARFEAAGVAVTRLERHAVGVSPIKLDLYVLNLGKR